MGAALPGNRIYRTTYPTVIPAPLYRPSRRFATVIPGPLPSFPRKRESRTALPYNAAYLSSNHGIPAYAGMTVERAAGMTVAAAARLSLPPRRLQPFLFLFPLIPHYHHYSGGDDAHHIADDPQEQAA